MQRRGESNPILKVLETCVLPVYFALIFLVERLGIEPSDSYLARITRSPLPAPYLVPPLTDQYLNRFPSVYFISVEMTVATFADNLLE